jgi:hypothetical protein
MFIDDVQIQRVLAFDLVIPDNQRGYDWKKYNADDFWEDMFAFEDDEKIDDYFLGSILLLDITTPKAKETSKDGRPIYPNKTPTYEILDGQQRLTTLYIFLIALRQIAKQHELDRIWYSCNDYLDSSLHSFKPSPSIAQAYNRMKKNSWNGKFEPGVGRQNQKVKPVYDFFIKGMNDEMEKFIENNENLDFEDLHEAKDDHFLKLLGKVTDIKIALITILNIEEGFMLFERLNSRGVPLSPTDLLKNYLFSKKEDITNLKEKWERITNPEEIKGTKIIQMVRYFYITRQGHITKGKLYRALKKLVKPNPEKFVKDLEKFSEFYKNYTSIEHANFEETRTLLDRFNIKLKSNADKLFSVFKSISGLNRYGIVQPIPLIYAYLAKYAELDLDNDEDYKQAVTYFLECLERFHFINNFILSEPNNRVETLYGNFAKRFTDVKEKREFDFVEKQLFAKLKLGSKEEFIDAYTNLEYNADGNKIKEIFCRIKMVNNVNGKCLPKSTASQYSLNPKLNIDTWNAEHWLAQNDKAGNEKLDNKDDLHNIGNLLLISTLLNNKLGNKSIPEKINYLTQNKLAADLQDPSLIRFIDEYTDYHENWNSEAIRKRAMKLAKDSYNIFWRFNYLDGLEKQKSRWSYISPDEIEQMSEDEIKDKIHFLETKVARNPTEEEILIRLKAEIIE